MSKYTAIFELKQMLEENNIDFEYNDLSNPLFIHYQIAYPQIEEEIVCSIIQGDGSYGGNANLLEIMGLLTADEEKS